MPSEDEIRQKCLEFQATWSDEERAKRLVGGTGSATPPPVEIRVISEASLRFEYGCEDSFSIEDLADTSGGS